MATKLRIRQATDNYGLQVQAIPRAIKRGEIPSKGTAGWVAELDVLRWLLDHPKIRCKTYSRAELRDRHARMSAANGSPDAPDEPPPKPQKPGKGGKGISEGLSGILLPEQIAEIQSALDLEPEEIEALETLGDVSKALEQRYSASQKHMQIMIDAGRLVDMEEVKVLVELVFSELLQEVSKLPSSIDSLVAKKAKVKVATARTALKIASKYLTEHIPHIADMLESQTKQFLSERKKGRAMKK